MNTLANVDVKYLYKANDGTVVFVIDLDRYHFLKDIRVVKMCMDDYSRKYPTTVSGWNCYFVDSELWIVVTGRIRWDNL